MLIFYNAKQFYDQKLCLFVTLFCCWTHSQENESKLIDICFQNRCRASLFIFGPNSSNIKSSCARLVRMLLGPRAIKCLIHFPGRKKKAEGSRINEDAWIIDWSFPVGNTMLTIESILDPLEWIIQNCFNHLEQRKHSNYGMISFLGANRLLNCVWLQWVSSQAVSGTNDIVLYPHLNLNLNLIW